MLTLFQRLLSHPKWLPLSDDSWALVHCRKSLPAPRVKLAAKCSAQASRPQALPVSEAQVLAVSAAERRLRRVSRMPLPVSPLRLVPVLKVSLLRLVRQVPVQVRVPAAPVSRDDRER